MSNPELASVLYTVGFTFILLGFIILAFNLSFQRKRTRREEVGGVILIGPFPIIFGTSRRMIKIMLVIAFVFIIIILLTSFLPSLIRGA